MWPFIETDGLALAFLPFYCLMFFSLNGVCPLILNLTFLLEWTVCPGSPYWSGRLSKVDLLEQASWHQLLFCFENTIYLLTKRVTLKRRSTVLRLSLQWVFPGLSLINCFRVKKLVMRSSISSRPFWGQYYNFLSEFTSFANILV